LAKLAARATIYVLRIGGSKVLVAVAGLLLLGGAANSAGFAVRSAALEKTWRAEEAAGVTPTQLAAARAQLAAMRAQWVGPLPYPVISGAAFLDPLGQVEAMTARDQAAAEASERQDAVAALYQVRDAGGPNYRAFYDHEVELGRTSRPADLKRLAARWRQEAARLRTLRDQLDAASGGLADGLPTDVVNGASRLDGLRASAIAGNLTSEPAGEARVDAQIYLALPYDRMLANHDAMLTELNAASGTLQKRLDLRQQVVSKSVKASGLLADLQQSGSQQDFPGRLDRARADLAGATTDDRLLAVGSALDGLVKEMQDAQAKRDRQRQAPAAAPPAAPCLQGASGKLIVIHLATQQLVAYDNGCPVLQTPVTTGRAALPTDRGTFHIFYKAPVYKMVSPWPKGNPFWYPDAYVYDAMEFVGDGTFIHSASWQPAGTYGPGSQNSPYASHGCVHVPPGPLQTLYSWAAIGTTVTVGD
jgi:L,D-transpeptidase catalytic domain